MIVESRWNVDWQGKPKFSEKTCPSATKSINTLSRQKSGGIIVSWPRLELSTFYIMAKQSTNDASSDGQYLFRMAPGVKIDCFLESTEWSS
jgi:hypothetical protein